MALTARQIALQGLAAPFPLSVIAIAVQGLLGADGEAPSDMVVPRSAIVGRGPGTTLNYSEFMRRVKAGCVLPMPAPDPAAERRAHCKKRQRREEETLALATFDIF